MLTFLQANLNRCCVAQDFLHSMARRRGTDVVFISEQHKDPDSTIWKSDITLPP